MEVIRIWKNKSKGVDGRGKTTRNEKSNIPEKFALKNTKIFALKNPKIFASKNTKIFALKNAKLRFAKSFASHVYKSNRFRS